MKSKRAWLAALVLCGAASVAGVCVVVTRDYSAKQPGPEAVVTAFAHAWDTYNFSDACAVIAPKDQNGCASNLFGAAIFQVMMGGATGRLYVVAGSEKRTGDKATVRVRAVYPGERPQTLTAKVERVDVDPGKKVRREWRLTSLA